MATTRIIADPITIYAPREASFPLLDASGRAGVPPLVVVSPGVRIKGRAVFDCGMVVWKGMAVAAPSWVAVWVGVLLADPEGGVVEG